MNIGGMGKKKKQQRYGKKSKIKIRSSKDEKSKKASPDEP